MTEGGAVDLAGLLIDVSDLSDEECESVARQVFQETCVDPAKAGDLLTHDGGSIRVFESRFEHAFFTSEKQSDWGHKKEILDLDRVERARWIVPLITGQVAPAECWEISQYSRGGKVERRQRLYVAKLESDPYIVWLKERNDGAWAFESAYPTGYKAITRYTHRQRRIWKRTQ